HRIGRFDLLAPEARLLRHDQHLKRRARLERVHQPQKPRALGELRAGDPVVAVDVLLGDGPAFPGGEGAGVFDLPRDGLRLVANTVLLVGFPRVNRGGSHGRTFSGTPAFLRAAASCRRARAISGSTRMADISSSWTFPSATWEMTCSITMDSSYAS